MSQHQKESPITTAHVLMDSLGKTVLVSTLDYVSVYYIHTYWIHPPLHTSTLTHSVQHFLWSWLHAKHHYLQLWADWWMWGCWTTLSKWRHLCEWPLSSALLLLPVCQWKYGAELWKWVCPTIHFFIYIGSIMECPHYNLHWWRKVCLSGVHMLWLLR